MSGTYSLRRLADMSLSDWMVADLFAATRLVDLMRSIWIARQVADRHGLRAGSPTTLELMQVEREWQREHYGQNKAKPGANDGSLLFWLE